MSQLFRLSRYVFLASQLKHKQVLLKYVIIESLQGLSPESLRVDHFGLICVLCVKTYPSPHLSLIITTTNCSATRPAFKLALLRVIMLKQHRTY